jgi:tRNA(fMet)-specific endonuclease VapC
MKPILIDTKVYSNAMVGNNTALEILKKNYNIGFSVISIGELLSGFKGGIKEAQNRRHANPNK